MKRNEYVMVAVLFIIFIAVTSSVPNLFLYGADLGINYGFPFNFYGYGGGPALLAGEPVPEYFSALNLVLDVFVWLIVSFVIVFIYSKVKKK
jgi:hypothetical protein